MAEYLVGNVARMKTAFYDPDTLVALDPSIVKLKLLSPAAVETTLVYGVDPIVKDAAGKYHYDRLWLLADVGTWVYKWLGEGTVTANDELPITVKQGAFTNP